jgi:hypothetical protein
MLGVVGAQIGTERFPYSSDLLMLMRGVIRRCSQTELLGRVAVVPVGTVLTTPVAGAQAESAPQAGANLVTVAFTINVRLSTPSTGG